MDHHRALVKAAADLHRVFSAHPAPSRTSRNAWERLTRLAERIHERAAGVPDFRSLREILRDCTAFAKQLASLEHVPLVLAAFLHVEEVAYRVERVLFSGPDAPVN